MNNVLKISVSDNESINNVINSIYKRLNEGELFDSAEITVNGNFNITEPIRFKDSCSFPVTVKGGENGAVFDGGWHIKNWRKTIFNGVDAWCAVVDRDRARSMIFDQLFVNGKRRYRPTYQLSMTGVKFDGEAEEKMDFSKAEKYWCTHNYAFYANEKLPDISNPGETVLNLNHCWLHERLPVEEIDYEKNIVYTKNTSLFCAFDNEMIYFENVAEQFKKPGQWYYSKNESIVYYIPLADEDMQNADVVIPAADELVHLENVSNKHFENIEFLYASSRNEYERMFPLSSKAYTCNTHRQAECEMPGAIQIISSKYCSVCNCTMAHMGRYAVELAKNSSNIYICNNVYFDMGTGAFKNHRDSCYDLYCSQDETSYVTITDNLISNYGTLFKAAVAILMTDVHHYIVSHNEIHHGEYSAISCGWVWGYEMANVGHNIIEYNYIHHIGNCNVNDMGAIYMLGVQPCTEIRNNLIHDVIDKENNGWGIYLDEGSSCMTVENNIVYRVSTDCMRIHYGKNNRIVNNIFAYGARTQLADGQYRPYIEMIMERNIFYSDHERMVFIRRGEGEMEFDKNLYYSESGDVRFCHNSYEKEPQYMSFTEWKNMGYDRFGITENPMFADAANGDFSLCDGSPAYKIGFKDIDISTVGIRK